MRDARIAYRQRFNKIGHHEGAHAQYETRVHALPSNWEPSCRVGLILNVELGRRGLWRWMGGNILDLLWRVGDGEKELRCEYERVTQS